MRRILEDLGHRVPRSGNSGGAGRARAARQARRAAREHLRVPQPIVTRNTGFAASFWKDARLPAVLLMLMSRSPWSSCAVSKYTIALIAGRLASSGMTLL